jgi:CBS domain-containing protein
MLKLREIMTTDLVTIDPELSVREAMSLLVSRHVSGAPVVDGNQVVGVVSATDLLEFAAGLPGLPLDDELAARLLGDMDEAEDEGTLADDGDVRFFAESWNSTDEDPVRREPFSVPAEWSALDEHTVSEAMTRSPLHTLPPDTAVPAAAEYLRKAKIHRVLIMTGQTLLGIVTTTDITNAVADGKLTART